MNDKQHVGPVSNEGKEHKAIPVGDDEFEEIVTERYMYSPKDAEGIPLVGWMLNVIQMPPMAMGKDRRTGEPILRDWAAFLIRTTETTFVKNREKEIVEVPPGTEVLIPATYTLAQYLSKAATHDTKVFKVKITPDKRIEIGGGKTMWTWKLGMNVKQPAKRENFGGAALLGPAAALPMLTAGSEVTPEDADTRFP